MTYLLHSVSLMQWNHGFDFLALTVVIVLAVIGYNRGFLEELARLAGLTISSLGAMELHGPFSRWLQLRTSVDDRLLSFAVFLFLFFTFLAGTRLLARFIQVFMLSKGIWWANKSLGLIFGTMKGVVLVAAILWMVDLAPNPGYFSELKTHSYVYRNFLSFRHRAVASFGLEEVVAKGETWIRDRVTPDR